jgi:4-hydroxy-3-methylbut-2-enyl diphosphate reductase
MALLIAKSAGFCFGVKRAMDMALEAARKEPQNLYTLGPLIHNPQAVQSLERSGIKLRDRIEDIPKGGRVLFRSHGVSLQDLEKAKRKKLSIIDATCPTVKKAQFFAKFLHRRGYSLLIVGDFHHPEVEAIRSYLGDGVEVVENADTVKRLGPWEKLGIIAQTTQSSSLFRDIVGVSSEKAREVRVFNTICHATTIRQREAVELARRVDCVIVIGGHNSGNTQRLAAICREIQPRTHQIETAEELDPRWFSKRQRIGLTAGASTPYWVIEEVRDGIVRLRGRRGAKFHCKMQQCKVSNAKCSGENSNPF